MSVFLERTYVCRNPLPAYDVVKSAVSADFCVSLFKIFQICDKISELQRAVIFINLSPRAFSEDGYIINQQKTGSVRFGLVSSARAGCGWIAAFNFLKALGRNPDPEKVKRDLERTCTVSFFGLNLFVLIGYLRKQGIELQYGIRTMHIQSLISSCRAGIFFYRAGKTNHYAAFIPEAGGTCRFLGVVPGKTNHRMTLAEFYWRYVKFPAALVLVAQ